VAGRALEHLAADRGIGAGVADDPRHDRRQPPLGIAAGRVVEADGVALGVDAHGLGAIEDQLDGPAGHVREEGGLPLDRHVLLAAEGPAARHQLHVDVVFRDAEEARDLPAVVEDALALGVEGQPPARHRLRERGLRLEEEVLDSLCAPGAAHDVSARGQGGGRVTAADHGAGQEIRVLRIDLGCFGGE
jgi:hypothetical protein